MMSLIYVETIAKERYWEMVRQAARQRAALAPVLRQRRKEARARLVARIRRLRRRWRPTAAEPRSRAEPASDGL